MSNVHFIDTSILVELLNIPNMADSHEQVVDEYQNLFRNGDSFVFPMAVLVETGNHIAHVDDGNLRRKLADKFAEFIIKAIDVKDNMSVIPEITLEELKKIMQSFPDQAMAKIGFGDTSIIEQFEDYWETRQPIGKMRIWSKDAHLSAYERTGGLSRRKYR